MEPAEKGAKMTDMSHAVNRAVAEMRAYQTSLRRDPAHAQVFVGGLQHALIPTRVLARDLPREIEPLVGPTASSVVLSRIGRVIGRAQAEAFFLDRGSASDDWSFRVLCGPLYFAWAGYGDVDILLWEQSSENDFDFLWESDNSFSAREALREGDRGRSCHMQAGYAAGWCEVATGIELETREIACRAEGVSHCRFLIAPTEGFEERIVKPRFHRATSTYSSIHIRASDVTVGETVPPTAVS